jgi:Tol biopolymer transport system component
LFPTFSGDGRHVAFTSLSTTQNFNGFTNTVHVMPASAGAQITDLFASADWSIPYLDWSPDGEQVAFLTINQGDAAIRVVNKAGGEVSIFDTGAPSYWHWRNDSEAMVTHLGGRASRPGTATISVIEASGPAKVDQTVLKELPGNFQSPHYAPDARHMLFVANTSQIDELVVADGAGQALCTIMPVASGAFFAWSPDGTQVAVLDTLTPVTDPAALTVYDLISGEHRVVHDRASTFFWSPSSSHLAVYSVVLDTTITPLSDAPTTGRRSAPLAQTRTAALRLEVIDTATGRSIRVADTYPSRQFLQYLQFFDQYSRAVNPWSPDGKHLVFSSVFQERGTADIAVATLNEARSGVDVRRIAAGTVAFWSPK